MILKCWMHLGRKPQKKRLESLEKDPLQSWRVTKQDWKHWKMYDEFVSAAERIIARTSTGQAPWAIIEGADRALPEPGGGCQAPRGDRAPPRRLRRARERTRSRPRRRTQSESGPRILVLSSLDLTKKLPKKDYPGSATSCRRG